VDKIFPHIRPALLYYKWGFPMSQRALQRLDVEGVDAPFHSEKRVPLQDLRRLAQRMRERAAIVGLEPSAIRDGELYAFCVLTVILRYISNLYDTRFAPGAFSRVRTKLLAESFPSPLPEIESTFACFYPPNDPALSSTGDAEPQETTEVLMREALLLQITEENPAVAPYRPLFDSSDLRAAVPFTEWENRTEHWLSGEPPFPSLRAPLPDVLRAPIRACPDSLIGQLEYCLRTWQFLLPPELWETLSVAVGTLREETLFRGVGPGPSMVLDFRRAYAEAGYSELEAFSPDRDWMPHVVLIAKSTLVWLDQLSKKYGRSIYRLDEIPDEELAQLRRWGFNALWLIGLWERSPASATIKRLTGNPEAAASAYSLYDYQIAHDLGGEAALFNLAERARRYGIRLASDMVPNHTGLYSRWIVEHPDWFIQTDVSPFPKYRFTGPNLSWDASIELYIEDGYWDRSDAAVVFKRVDTRTGRVRYIYHGNDGTSTPWNDTAQLNFLLPGVREAVIQTILRVAKMFPIIRFDAAMTLTKKHYQRLWFPLPGEGGAIPSRAAFSMTREEFDRAFPHEFWREVVDRVAVEAPDTLLLAEAFWLMEGYFVRSLGMHRVYNSAFMNMLKREENANYRQTLKNVLEFSPEVLQRFVNFMNNPDEETAIEQFGDGDKYFGVCLMMVTLPGLPMFGHGQIEGFREKYGMEYRRAYWNETPNEALIRRHEKEIFPLLRHRRLFSGATHFAFFDFVTPQGWVDENVFAYTNRYGESRALVLYNNAYNTTRGTISLSTAINLGRADTPSIHRISLTDALALGHNENVYWICREHRSGLEYLFATHTVKHEGITLDLPGYGYLLFLDWQPVEDHDGSWATLYTRLGGKGVPSIREAYEELRLSPIWDVVVAAFSPSVFDETVRGNVEALLNAFLQIVRILGTQEQSEAAHVVIKETLVRANTTFEQILTPHESSPERLHEVHAFLDNLGLRGFALTPAFRMVFMLSTLFRHLPLALGLSDKAQSPENDARVAHHRWCEWRLDRPMATVLGQWVPTTAESRRWALLIELILQGVATLDGLREEMWAPLLSVWLRSRNANEFLQVHEYNHRHWFIKERMEELVSSTVLALAAWQNDDGRGEEKTYGALENAQFLLDAAQDCGYDFYWFLDVLK